ncbi:MAG: Methionine-tRNA ligase [Candidatus Uhrbacteria bacterium GW2011_GWA2_52_8d]|uniref:methionine--tRNA ligase n=1 Tax=Candidatus Uhrbacteria bacterium GW2011_GWA2_52_8d TaxID=1618979 RepID=A0A0G1XL49_9BACT|nr:MAG: Methionine-tRNA ligase [Candidatus Uhrbacteria bacterium GW2011_GWA2_52_8d]
MSRYIYVGSAWPYVNGPLHLGHVAGLVSADVIARYHRLVGDEVLWTSGSDCHGTPITERARKEGRTAREVAQQYHGVVKLTFERLGFSYSLYWATMEPEHHARVQESFSALYKAGYIMEGEYKHARCDHCGESRADREINGICPSCQAEARGDQCDTCGKELNPSELLNPVCAKCSSKITFETTRELFLNLPVLEERLREWVASQGHWRENANRVSDGQQAVGAHGGKPGCLETVLGARRGACLLRDRQGQHPVSYAHVAGDPDVSWSGSALAHRLKRVPRF